MLCGGEPVLLNGWWSRVTAAASTNAEITENQFKKKKEKEGNQNKK
jgi:hypothetical protein